MPGELLIYLFQYPALGSFLHTVVQQAHQKPQAVIIPQLRVARPFPLADIAYIGHQFRVKLAREGAPNGVGLPTLYKIPATGNRQASKA